MSERQVDYVVLISLVVGAVLTAALILGLLR